MLGQVAGPRIFKVQNPIQRQVNEDKRRHHERHGKIYKDADSSLGNAYTRSQEVESDGFLLEEHDSFYKATKSLLVLFQIMGVMPIMRPSPGVTTFSWLSRATYWAYFIYALETVYVVMVAKGRLERFIGNSGKRFDEIIYHIIFMSILTPHFLLPIASWRSGPEVAKFKNMWTQYQLKYFRVTGNSIVFPNLHTITWALCVFSWVLSVLVILSQYFLQPDFHFLHTFAYFHILAMLNGFCTLWFINCTAFGTASHGLACNLRKALKSENPSQKLAEYRHLWVDLSHMMQQLGRAYSNMYALYCVVIFFTTIIATYGVLSETLDRGLTFKELGLFLIAFYCVSLLFVICNEAYHASRKVGLEFQERLLNVNLAAVDYSTQREVEMFLVAINKNPPIMNLNGYANINRQLITTNVSIMSTYLVVLMQFKWSLSHSGASFSSANSTTATPT